MDRTYIEFCYLPHSKFPVPVVSALSTNPNKNEGLINTETGPFVAVQLQNVFDSRRFQAWLRETKINVDDKIGKKDVVIVPCSWIIKTFSTKPSTEQLLKESQTPDKPEVGDFVVWVNNFIIAKVESISAKDLENTEGYADYATISYCQSLHYPPKDCEPRPVKEVQVPLSQLLSLSELLKLQSMTKQSRLIDEVATTSVIWKIWNGERFPMLFFPQESTPLIPPEVDVNKNTNEDSFQEEKQNRNVTAFQPLTKSKVTQDELSEEEMDTSEPHEQKELEKLSKSSENEEIEGKFKVVEKSKKKKNKKKPIPGTSQRIKAETNVKKIQVYGYCYMTENKYCLRDLKPDEVQVDDLVIAKLKIHHGIVGHVRKICRIVTSFGVKEIMVGIEFDQPLTCLKEFVEIGHSHSYRYSCDSYADCKYDLWIFIELDALLSKENHVFLLQRQTPAKTMKKPIESIKFDIKIEAGRREVFKTEPIITHNDKRNLDGIGIQGNYNSCYADSFFFSIFAFTSAFDQHIFRNLSNAGESKEKFLVQNAVQNIIMYDIVNPLRSKSQVEWEAIQKLRNVLAENFNPSFKDKMMDVEEFALTLFEEFLKVPGFFAYDTETTDHIHQIFTSDAEAVSPGKFPDLETLLIESFKLSGVKLGNIPNPGFLVKLPVYDGVPVFQRVFINPILSLENLLEKAEKKAELHLRAVICLQNKHFTCFVKPLKDLKKKQPWIYFDSLPEDDKTFCVEIPDIECKSGMEWANKLMSTCYLCIYESPNVTNEYKEDEEEGEGTCV